MARRDLSRTLLEGWRHRREKSVFRAAASSARTRERAWLEHVRMDEDLYDYRTIERASPLHRRSNNKTAAFDRWLRRQVGRPWNDVFGELRSRFDTRTFAGRNLEERVAHCVRGVSEDERWRIYAFEVDTDGIFRALPSWRELRKEVKPPPWTEGNFAFQIAKRWWWVGNRPIEPCVHVAKCSLDHLVVDGVPRHYSRNTRLRPLTPTEVGRLTSLPPRVREVVLWRATS